MRRVTSRAAVTHRVVLKDNQASLFVMALRARFVLTSEGHPTSAFENICAMWIVALHAGHLSFNDRVALWQVEFRMLLGMTSKAGAGIFTRIDDQSTPATCIYVQTARAMARFAADSSGNFC